MSRIVPYLICITALCHIISAQVDTCQYGFMQHGTSCYLFSILQASWIQAYKLCQIYGGDLAVIETEAEQLWIESYLNKTWTKANQTDGIWLGGTDLLVENEWVWVKTGQSIGYSRWAQNAPNHVTATGVDESCLAIVPHDTFMWNDESCEKPLNFLCESTLAFGQPSVIG